MLVSASDGTTFWYAQDAVVVTPGQLTQRTVRPSSLAPPTAVSIRVDDKDVPASWKRWTSLGISLAPRITFNLQGASEDAARIPFPLLAGAKARVYANAQGAQTNADNWSSGASALVASSSGEASVDVELFDDLDLDTPKSLQTIPVNTPTYAWKHTRAGTTTIGLTRTDYSTGSVSIVTDESHIDLARLEKLGMPKLTAGEYQMYLSSYLGATVDAYDYGATESTKAAAAYHAIKFTLQ